MEKKVPKPLIQYVAQLSNDLRGARGDLFTVCFPHLRFGHQPHKVEKTVEVPQVVPA